MAPARINQDKDKDKNSSNDGLDKDKDKSGDDDSDKNEKFGLSTDKDGTIKELEQKMEVWKGTDKREVEAPLKNQS